MKRRAEMLLPVVLVVAVAVGIYWWVKKRGEEAPMGLVASGTVEATQADLGFQLPGRIASVSPREGDDVAAGEEVATLEHEELATRVKAAAAQLAAAEARLEELQRGSRPEEITSAAAAVEGARQREGAAETEATRSRRLFEGGAISRQALEQAEAALSAAHTARVQAEQALAIAREGPRAETVQAQRALVSQARANVDQAQSALDQSKIHSPFAGRITVRHREPGEIVPAGAPVLTLLNPDDRWVRIYVPENQIGRVSIGQRAEVRAGTFPDRVYGGEVAFIGDVAEFTPRNVQTPEERTRLVYPVKVRITGDPGFDLKPGIPADVLLPESGGAPPSSTM